MVLDELFTFTYGLWIGGFLGVIAGVLLVWEVQYAKGYEAAQLEKLRILWRFK